MGTTREPALQIEEGLPPSISQSAPRVEDSGPDSWCWEKLMSMRIDPS
jgi:hypothetical protein